MKVKNSLALAATVFALVSCEQEQLSSDVLSPNVEAISSNEIRACLDKTIIHDDPVDSRSGKTLAKFKLWENGKTLTIKFLGGSDFLQERVMYYAKVWEQYANIKFEEVTSGDADLRISFEQTGASWSYVGKDANYLTQDQVTMNFGWFKDYTLESELQRTTLHEFGHALGAIHEHQSPDSNIQWNKPAAYEYYAIANGWSEEDVDRDVFAKYFETLSTNSEYDSESIMHYPIDAALTLDGYSVGLNYSLSDTDKSFIGETYPFDEVSEEEEEEEVTVENENLAFGKETSQISTHEDLPGESSRAVDGDTSGRWSLGSITRTATEYRPWWQVRLGKEYAIGEIKIWNRTDSCCAMKLANFDVFVYNDAGELTYKTTIEDAPSPSVTFNAKGAIGSRVRIKLKDTNQLSLAEVEVYKF